MTWKWWEPILCSKFHKSGPLRWYSLQIGLTNPQFKGNTYLKPVFWISINYLWFSSVSFGTFGYFVIIWFSRFSGWRPVTEMTDLSGESSGDVIDSWCRTHLTSFELLNFLLSWQQNSLIPIDTTTKNINSTNRAMKTIAWLYVKFPLKIELGHSHFRGQFICDTQYK